MIFAGMAVDVYRVRMALRSEDLYMERDNDGTGK